MYYIVIQKLNIMSTTILSVRVNDDERSLLELLAAHVFDGSATLAPAPIAVSEPGEDLEKN